MEEQKRNYIRRMCCAVILATTIGALFLYIFQKNGVKRICISNGVHIYILGLMLAPITVELPQVCITCKTFRPSAPSHPIFAKPRPSCLCSELLNGLSTLACVVSKHFTRLIQCSWSRNDLVVHRWRRFSICDLLASSIKCHAFMAILFSDFCTSIFSLQMSAGHAREKGLRASDQEWCIQTFPRCSLQWWAEPAKLCMHRMA